MSRMQSNAITQSQGRLHAVSYTVDPNQKSVSWVLGEWIQKWTYEYILNPFIFYPILCHFCLMDVYIIFIDAGISLLLFANWVFYSSVEAYTIIFSNIIEFHFITFSSQCCLILTDDYNYLNHDWLLGQLTMVTYMII